MDGAGTRKKAVLGAVQSTLEHWSVLFEYSIISVYLQLKQLGAKNSKTQRDASILCQRQGWESGWLCIITTWPQLLPCHGFHIRASISISAWNCKSSYFKIYFEGNCHQSSARLANLDQAKSHSLARNCTCDKPHKLAHAVPVEPRNSAFQQLGVDVATSNSLEQVHSLMIALFPIKRKQTCHFEYFAHDH